jgi:hypothetical protein
MNIERYFSNQGSLKQRLTLVFSLALLQVTTSFIVSFLFHSEWNFLAWDAEHYFAISQFGYKEKFITAFFPVLPAVWGLFGLTPELMSLVNFIIWLLILVATSKLLTLSNLEIVIIQLLPSTIFMGLPYSESFFAAACLIIMIGLKKNRIEVSGIGFFIANLVRPAGTIFIPAIIIIEMISKRSVAKKIRNILVLVGCNLLGLMAVSRFQMFYGWSWDISISAQAMWGNELQIPSLPFKSWGGNWNSRFDGLVLFFVLAVFARTLLTIYKDGIRSISVTNQFALLYVFGITASVVLFRGGLLFSLNRFVFSTIMGGLVFVYFFRNFNWSKKEMIIYSLGSLVFFLIFFSAYNHIQNLLGYGLFALIVCTLFFTLARYEGSNRINVIAGLVLLFGLQQYCLYLFLNNFWIG